MEKRAAGANLPDRSSRRGSSLKVNVFTSQGISLLLENGGR
jgi:hypothetical protein